MRRTQTIPPSHWAAYLKAASRRFHDQPVELDFSEADAFERPIAHGLYFLGASLEAGYRSAVVLQLAGLGHPERHLSHRVAGPTMVVRELDDNGELERLVIHDENRRHTAIVFHDGTPAPGPRRLAPRSEASHCDDPRCPLTPA